MLLVAPNKDTKDITLYKGYQIERVEAGPGSAPLVPVRFRITRPDGEPMETQSSLKSARTVINLREAHLAKETALRLDYDAETGRIVTVPGGRVYGFSEAAARLSLTPSTYRGRQERSGRAYVPDVLVGASYLAAENALDERRERDGLGAYDDLALPCAQAGKSGVLLTRAGAAKMLGISVAWLRQISTTALPQQRAAQLILYRLEDIEARRGGRAKQEKQQAIQDEAGALAWKEWME